MLRNEVLWATRGLGNGIRIRTAKVEWQGRAATCLLVSDSDEDARVAPRGRDWGEEEYCMDNATATLVVHSIAPGTYSLFTYGGAPFRGYSLPGRVQIYVNGGLAVDGTFTIADATQADAESLTPTAEMTGTPAPIGLMGPFLARTEAGSGNARQSVVVHAEIDGEGNVVEAELSAAVNPGLFQAALQQIRSMKFGQTGAERQAYIDVRF